MSCNDKNQSSIAEVRDQLFIDTADGIRLDGVTGNLGLNRPGIGFGDDEWRAVAKLIALQPKLIRSQFFNLIELCLGPQYARVGTLSANTAATDSIFTSDEAAGFVQLGTMVIDPTLPTEETVNYCFRDKRTKEFFTKTELLYNHTVIAPGATRLSADAPAGSLTIQVSSTSSSGALSPLASPTYPYPVMLDRGTLVEEVVQVVSRLGNVLTLASATLYDHKGPENRYAHTTVSLPVITSGNGDTIGGAAPNMTLTDAGASFSSGEIGSYITLSGSTTGSNNGTFLITAIGGPTTLTYTNAAGVAEPFAGGWDITRGTVAGRTFLTVETNDVRKFPVSGFINIAAGTANAEVAEYESTDLATNSFNIRGVLTNPHLELESVDLCTGGALVEVAQLVEYGTHWQLRETAPRHVQIIIPRSNTSLRLLDASWLHGKVQAPVSTVTTAPAVAGDTVLTLASVNGLTPTGMVQVGTDVLFYGSIDLFLPQINLSKPLVNPIPIGSVVSLYDVPYVTSSTGTGDVIFGGPGVQTLTSAAAAFSSTDIGSYVKIQGATNPVNDGTFLIIGIVNANSIDYVNSSGVPEAVFPGSWTIVTSLAEGNYLDALGNLSLNHFPGGYVFDVTQRGVSNIFTYLSKSIPPHINVAFSQLAGRTNLEVSDASLWPTPPFSPIAVQVGVGSGSQEDRTLFNVSLAASVGGQVSAPVLAGVTSLSFALTGSAFPTSDGLNPAGYRVILGEGTVNEEYIVVAQVSGGVMSFVSPTTNPHAALETIKLTNDVLTFDVLQNNHTGPIYSTSQTYPGDVVAPLVNELLVSPSPSSFPTANGWIILNFGKEIPNFRKKITAITGLSSLEIEYFIADGETPTDLPAGTFAVGDQYQLIVGDGLYTEQKMFVQSNFITSTAVIGGQLRKNSITFASSLDPAVAVGQYVRFISGDAEAVEYQVKDSVPDRLVFSTSVVFGSRHLVGERVIYSPALSQSNADGSSFGFKLPPDPAGCSRSIVELLRAAGVQVTFITQ